MTANVSDPCGTTFSYQWYSNNTCTTAINGATSSTYTYTKQTEPATKYVYYKVKDANNAWSSCATATATWNNVAPTANAVSNSANENVDVVLTANVSDPGSTTFTYKWYSDSSCSSAISNATSSTYTYTKQTEPTTKYVYYKAFDTQ